MTLQFNSRDTRPKLTALWILTAVAVVVIGALMIIDSERFGLAAAVLMAAYAFGVVLILLWAFREQLRYDPYSYNTIFYIGFALFAFSIVLTYISLAVNMVRYADYYTSNEIIHGILGSAKRYMIFSSPFLLIFSIALCISNISLIRHEGKRVVNVLGIILSFLLMGGVVFLFVYDFAASGSMMEVMRHDLIINLFAAIYLYFECMLIGAIIAGAIAAHYKPGPEQDFVIVLGCGLREDGTPTPLLRGRLDRALRFAEEQRQQTGRPLTFVTSGGQGSDEAVSESTAMKNYLMEQGVPEEQIIEEDQSANTLQNMQFSRAKIEAVRKDAKVAFSTTNYHVFRSGIFARMADMRAVGMGARTKWYFWPNAAVREFVGLLTKHRVMQGVILGVMIVIYIALTLYAFLGA